MQLSFVQILFGTFPESLLLVYVGLGVFGGKTNFKNYITICVIYNIILEIARIFYGLHSVILCIVLGVLIKFIVDVDWKSAIMSSLTGFIILFIGESLFLPLAFNYLDVSIKEVHKNLSLYFELFYLSKIPLLTCAFIIHFFEFNLGGLVGDEEWFQV